jgi:soluble lytic murein transglycosylase
LSLKIRPMLVASAALLATAGLALGQSQLPYHTSSDAPSADAASVAPAISAAKAGDAARARAYMAGFSDSAARKLVLWELLDAYPEALSFTEADGALRDLDGWPHPARRTAAAEKQLAGAGLAPSAVVAWFGGKAPSTAQGAMALASALNATGQIGPAADLIRQMWRTLPCDQDTQNAILARFGAVLTGADHLARADRLLYGPHGPATQDMVRLLPPEQQALALARIAVRAGDPNAAALIGALPAPMQTSPGLAYERALSLRDHGQPDAALALVGYLPDTLPDEAAERLWRHGNLAEAALRTGDYQRAYLAAAHSGLTSGADAAEAEFEAGWLALTRLKDAKLADDHFARLQAVGPTTLTQSRAFYWRGRAAEAMGDPVAAQLFYIQAAHFQTAFYGQLAGAKVGMATLNLGHDPTVTAADLAQFEGRDVIRAARMLFQTGSKDLYYAFVVGLSETLLSAAEEAMLVDFTRGLGDQSLSMRVVRNAAKRGFILPERGYPIHAPPASYDGAEAAFVLGVTRQESSFDPRARSGSGARGMMQLMPATAQLIARRIGAAGGDLDDPDYNMRIGSAYLAQLVDQFGGSYVMATAAYNAGPGRPPQWAAECGDPRSSSADPLAFIECIPFSETRDYVMRVMEATQVYRARLNGGTAPNTLANDLKRGSYGYAALAAAGPVTR